MTDYILSLSEYDVCSYIYTTGDAFLVSICSSFFFFFWFCLPAWTIRINRLCQGKLSCVGRSKLDGWLGRVFFFYFHSPVYLFIIPFFFLSLARLGFMVLD